MPDDPSLAGLVVSKSVRVDGRRVAYREEPQPRPDRPLVLIHGLGMSSASFRALLPQLVADFHVMAPDLPGCGDSERGSRTMGVAELVDGLVVWFDAVGLDRVDLLGHSLGGQIVVRLAARHPDRVGRAVLVAATPDPSAPYPWQAAVRLLQNAVREPPAVIRQAVGDYLRATPRLMWRTLRRALKSDAATMARQMPAPTLVVRGSRDPVVSQAWAEELARLIPDARLEVIDGGTHGLPIQSAPQLGAVVRAFLD